MAASKKSIFGKTWMFTLNNYTDAQVEWCESYSELDAVTRMTVSKEIGESGTPHLQGCITWKTGKRLAAMKKLLYEAHWEKADSPDDAHAYPCKADSEMIVQVDKRSKGKRVDLDDMAKAILECDTLHEVMLVPGVAKYHSWAEKLWTTRPLEAESIADFRPWQHALYLELLQEPDDRKVIWYHDEAGGAGKTTMARHLITMGAFYCRNGKTADLCYAYANQRIIVIDLARSVEGHVNYNVIETLKDGLMFSTKYMSATKVRKGAAHVVVMANFLPDMSKMSVDRWDIRSTAVLPASVPGFVPPVVPTVQLPQSPLVINDDADMDDWLGDLSFLDD